MQDYTSCLFHKILNSFREGFFFHSPWPVLSAGHTDAIDVGYRQCHVHVNMPNVWQVVLQIVVFSPTRYRYWRPQNDRKLVETTEIWHPTFWRLYNYLIGGSVSTEGLSPQWQIQGRGGGQGGQGGHHIFKLSGRACPHPLAPPPPQNTPNQSAGSAPAPVL